MPLNDGADKTRMTTAGDSAKVKLIALYLTQFHPIPENDAWWGKGFTEWTNVTRARPLFAGHYQPHLPADLGFYDLRLRAVRREQIAMAKAHGIDAFCYHYYWFSGTRLLNQPLDDMLADPESDMPFCLCWANENWTRRWDAAEHEILIAQKYLPDDDLNFIKDLMPFFRDRRYVRLDGAPLLTVYRPQHLPDARKTLRIWREYCASVGIPKLHLCAAMTHGNWDFQQYGFDSGMEFPPHNIKGPFVTDRFDFNVAFEGAVADYEAVARFYLDREYGAHRSGFRSVFPGWDNTARRGTKALVTVNATPENYEYWLAEAIRRTKREFPGQDRFVFINAWNEWAEGCHLEPDEKYGRRFLEATAIAKSGDSTRVDFAYRGMPGVPAANRSFVKDVSAVVRAYWPHWRGRGKRMVRKVVRAVIKKPFQRVKRALRV